jgi:ADP-ribose pyrophosphatase YjhB (NUDIX family)
MASTGPRYYVVVVHVGGTKTANIKVLSQRKTCAGKSWFLTGVIFPNEELVDVAAREMFEETDFTLTVDELTLLSGAHVRDSLPGDKLQHVYVYLAYIHVPYVNANLRTPIKVEHVVTAQSNIHHDGSYVAQTTMDIDGLTMTPYVTDIVKESQHKFELLHFGLLAQ